MWHDMAEHQRSLRSRMFRYSKRYVLTNSYRDFRLAETICKNTPSQVTEVLMQNITTFNDGSIAIEESWNTASQVGNLFDKGDVLCDQRGRGTLQ